MAYYTKNEARQAAYTTINKSFRNNSKSILESEFRDTKSYDKFDVFLSHSSKDADLVLGVKALLEKHGLKVYVDWHDDPQASRENVTKETAELLRARMKQSKSLIFMATNNASNSKWMPWELGYFDGFSSGSVAVLPLVEHSSDSFKGQEYLDIYPKVDKGYYSDTGSAETFVKKDDGWQTLSKFGSGNICWNKYS